MDGPILERDWKYLRSIHDEILDELCSRILKKADEIANAETDRPHHRYLALFKHIQDSDDIVADCFNDWRRSNISNKILNLRHNRLLTDEHVIHMSSSAQDWQK
jgi:hypothetical protein